MRFGVELIAGGLALSVVPQFTGELLPHLIERDGSNISSSPAPASKLNEFAGRLLPYGQKVARQLSFAMER